MDHDQKPFRSVLYIPGSNERALDKARTLPVDAIIFDLEDAVAPAAKTAARDSLVQALAEGGYGLRTTLVRINALDTDWGADDLTALAEAQPDAILLPKPNDGSDIAKLAKRMDQLADYADTRIWAMIETPAGLLNASAIAHGPRMSGFVLGTNDLSHDLKLKVSDNRAEMMTALQLAVLAARAAGIIVVDGVYNAFRDLEGLESECRQGRALGFDGKSLIHPAQVDSANAIFGLSDEELELAKRQIEAFEKAEAQGQGVAVLDGKIVENLHVNAARRNLARAEVIRKIEAD